MDKWKDLELEKMKIGGNRNALEFLQSQADYNHTASFQVKYNSNAAALYRDKLTCEARGKPWSIESSAAKNYQSSAIPKSSSSPSINHSSKSNYETSSIDNGFGGFQSAYQDEGYQGGYQNGALKSLTDSFFSRVQDENLRRPDHLPPSQGGKYSGFGNTPNPPPKSASTELFDTTVSNLSSGWAMFSLGATKFAQKAAEVSAVAAEKATEYGQTIQEKVKEGKLMDELSIQASALTSKVSETARSWNSGGSVTSLMGSNQHQRLEGNAGDDLLSPGTQSQHSYQSSPTLLEKGKDKSLFGSSDNGYQRLSSQSGVRKNSWGNGWGDDWGSGENETPVQKTEKKINTPPIRTKAPESKKTSKDLKSSGDSLLIDFETTTSASEKRKSEKKGHTWDNWDDDGWDKLQ